LWICPRAVSAADLVIRACDIVEIESRVMRK
jgi:hypothetical protein